MSYGKKGQEQKWQHNTLINNYNLAEFYNKFYIKLVGYYYLLLH